MQIPALVFSPNQLINHAGKTLDNPHNLAGDILIQIVRNRDPVFPRGIHGNSGLHGLEQGVLPNPGQEKAALLHSLRAFGRSADAHRREGPADGGEEAALLRQGAAVADHGKGVHLQAVVIMEPQGLMPDNPPIQPEPAPLQAFAGAGMAGVQNRHIIPFRQLIHRRKQGQEIPLRVNIFLPVGGKQDILPLFQPQPLVDARRLNLGQVGPQHLRHRGARHESALLGQAALRQIPPGVLGVSQVYVGDDVHNPAVGLLRQAFVLAAVSRLHMENGDVEPLGGDGGEAGIRIPQNQEGVRLQLRHQLVGTVDDIPNGRA